MPIEPGTVDRLDISIEPMTLRFKKCNRIRLEAVDGDCARTDVLWTHCCPPSEIGADTIHQSAEDPSARVPTFRYEVPDRTCRVRCRNFKSAALVHPAMPGA